MAEDRAPAEVPGVPHRWTLLPGALHPRLQPRRASGSGSAPMHPPWAGKDGVCRGFSAPSPRCQEDELPSAVTCGGVAGKGRGRKSSSGQAAGHFLAQLLRHVTVVLRLWAGLELPAATQGLHLCISASPLSPQTQKGTLAGTLVSRGHSRVSRRCHAPGVIHLRLLSKGARGTRSDPGGSKLPPFTLWEQRKTSQEGQCWMQGVRTCICGRHFSATFFPSLGIFGMLLRNSPLGRAKSLLL